jgi:Calcium-activated chloride channel
MEEEEIRHLVEIAGGAMDEGLEKRHIQALNKRLLLEQAQDPMWLEVMLPLHDSFPEYIQAVVQFTYVACFSVALPITPLIVLFNYLVGMRLDAYKICKGRRRPLAEKTGGIGIWEHLLHIVSVIGVLTNCWLVGFTSSLFRSIGDSVTQVGLFAIVVGWEHIMLLIKYVMQTSISSLPLSVANSIRREQHELEQQRSSSMRFRRLKHQRDEELYQQQQLHEMASKARNESLGGSETPCAASSSSLARPDNLMSC